MTIKDRTLAVMAIGTVADDRDRMDLWNETVVDRRQFGLVGEPPSGLPAAHEVRLHAALELHRRSPRRQPSSVPSA